MRILQSRVHERQPTGRTRRRPKGQRQEEAAIEGFPLYLMILAIFGVVGAALMLQLFSQVQTPRSVGDVVITPTSLVVKDPDGDDRYTTDEATLTIIVTDSANDRVKGATVSLSGNSITDSSGSQVHGTTDSKGMVGFSDLHLEVIGSPQPVVIKVEKAGLGERMLNLPVVKE